MTSKKITICGKEVELFYCAATENGYERILVDLHTDWEANDDGQFSDETIYKWLTVFIKRFFSQQFKRSCLPDGPKVGSVSLSPRGDWRMPSDASAASWLAECDEL